MKTNACEIVSYITLRRLIGVLGMALPLICIAGGALFAGTPGQRSISYYYHTNMRDFLVGLLVAVSMFFITYRGYDRNDRLITWIIGLAGMGLAFFPILCAENPDAPAGLFQMDGHIASGIHVASAGVFFVLLALNSIFLFTRHGEKSSVISKNKKIRNMIYIACGFLILSALAAFVMLWFVRGKVWLNQSRWVLALQTVMLLAFGVSWLVKGETLFRDRKTC